MNTTNTRVSNSEPSMNHTGESDHDLDNQIGPFTTFAWNICEGIPEGVPEKMQGGIDGLIQTLAAETDDIKLWSPFIVRPLYNLLRNNFICLKSVYHSEEEDKPYDTPYKDGENPHQLDDEVLHKLVSKVGTKNTLINLGFRSGDIKSYNRLFKVLQPSQRSDTDVDGVNGPLLRLRAEILEWEGITFEFNLQPYIWVRNAPDTAVIAVRATSVMIKSGEQKFKETIKRSFSEFEAFNVITQDVICPTAKEIFEDFINLTNTRMSSGSVPCDSIWTIESINAAIEDPESFQALIPDSIGTTPEQILDLLDSEDSSSKFLLGNLIHSAFKRRKKDLDIDGSCCLADVEETNQITTQMARDHLFGNANKAEWNNQQRESRQSPMPAKDKTASGDKNEVDWKFVDDNDLKWINDPAWEELLQPLNTFLNRWFSANCKRREHGRRYIAWTEDADNTKKIPNIIHALGLVHEDLINILANRDAFLEILGSMDVTILHLKKMGLTLSSFGIDLFSKNACNKLESILQEEGQNHALLELREPITNIQTFSRNLDTDQINLVRNMGMNNKFTFIVDQLRRRRKWLKSSHYKEMEILRINQNTDLLNRGLRLRRYFHYGCAGLQVEYLDTNHFKETLFGLSTYNKKQLLTMLGGNSGPIQWGQHISNMTPFFHVSSSDSRQDPPSPSTISPGMDCYLRTAKVKIAGPEELETSC
jgi:hypothetical protein